MLPFQTPISPQVGMASQEVFELGDPRGLARQRGVALLEQPHERLGTGLMVA